MKKVRKFLTALCIALSCSASLSALAACNGETQNNAITEYEITFLDKDGTPILNTKIKENDVPEFNGTLPALPENTAEYTYSWKWDKEFVAATGNASYKLILESTKRKYDVKFMDGETQIGATQNVEYGTIATKPADPQKAETAEKTYTFDGWYTAAEGGEKVTDFTVTGAVTYYAHYTYTIRSYTIRFLNGETVLKSVTLDYGTKLSVPEDISVEGYVIIGWNQDLPETVTGNADFVAVLAKELKQADAANFAAILAANPNDDYVLGSDIDFGGAELDGIGTFGGIFDGRGYALKNFNLKYNQYTSIQWSYAFIANNAGTIKNVAITYTLKANNNYEAFIQENNGTIENVYVSVYFESRPWCGAPIAGINTSNGVIKNCITVLTKNASDTGNGGVGAIVGAD